MRRALAAVLAVVVLALAGCGGGAQSTPGSLHGKLVDPPFEPSGAALVDTSGAGYSLTKSTDNRLTLVFFGYTHCPDICGIVMSNLASAMTRLDDADRTQVDVVFVTTDPSRDTGPVLRTYLDRYDPSFIGLTGDLDTIAAIGKTVAVGVTSGAKLPSGGYDLNTHSTQVTGIDPDDRAPIYWGQGTTPQQYAQDIHSLLEESS